MRTRIEKVQQLAVRAAEAARLVGLTSAADFRLEFGGFVKPLPLQRAELYSVAAITRVVASLAGDVAPASDVAWHEKRALESLA